MVLPFVFCLFLSGVAAERECWNCEGGGPTYPGNCTYTPDWHPQLQYDPNNPQEIDGETPITLSIIGGISPYIWNVSGYGFTLSQDETYGLYNTLDADSTACGTATITVTDAQNETVTGYVRCTTGKWSDWNSSRRRLAYCSNPWVNTCNEDSHTRTLIVGKSKWTFGSFHGYFCTDSPDCFVWTEPGMPTPEPPCGSPYGCWDGGTCPTCAPIGRPHPFFEVCDYSEWQCEWCRKDLIRESCTLSNFCTMPPISPY